MMTTMRIKTPTSFWIIAVLSLLWNGFGANDYMQMHLQNRAYIEGMTQGMNLTVDELIAFYAARPWWVDAFWALGVWGSVAGSLLLLMRSRHALAAFLVSLVGLIVTSVLGFVDPIPGQTDLTFPIILTAIVFAVLFALIFYTRRMIARRVIA
ncbi:hypothetical protein EKN06_12760 [Croceicoccus ponticola]|uniref:Uncharacterized protein n=1 Tax=Croceicoccus ponticola TaxID=2217664 RepID=A0A437GVJ5_9SPHN|nr:hypothetical protein [Croceicoccus ponticola]RVQ65792.1 hypothetical protein EKN06_12760 [Croceicoccus ponticola]